MGIHHKTRKIEFQVQKGHLLFVCTTVVQLGFLRLSNLFTKELKNSLLQHKRLFSLYFKFQLIWDELPLKRM